MKTIMEEVRPYWQNALRWVLVPIVPLFCYLLVKYLVSSATSQSWGISLDDTSDSHLSVNSLRDVFVMVVAFFVEAVATGSALVSACAVAPAKKRSVFVSAATITGLLILILIFLSGVYFMQNGTSLLSIVVSIFGLIGGVVGAGVYVWDEYGDDGVDSMTVLERCLFAFCGFLVIVAGILLLIRGVATSNLNESSEASSIEATNADCHIKGNINSEGEKIYHLPADKYYDVTDIDTSVGERWFCNEEDALSAGWRHARI